jgi:DNA mismatch repair protein MutS
MNFYTDRQTIDDLNIFGKRGKLSIYSIFNRTYTKGGADLLEQMFRHPLGDITAINNRISCIRYFGQLKWDFIKNFQIFEAVAMYLSLRDGRSKLNHTDQGLSKVMRSALRPDMDLQMIKKGIHALTNLVQQFKTFWDQHGTALPTEHPLQVEFTAIQRILQLPELQFVYTVPPSGKISFDVQVKLDQLLRFHYYNEMQQILHYCSLMDVYMTVATLAESKKFIFPEPVEQPANLLELKDVFHPELEKPIANDLTLNEEQNLLFLTGANMAGKSTFMKSVGIAVYLAHMGFPVPATSMRFSVRNGMLTTINLSDNLNQGLSHFYSEVMRVKKVAAALQKGLNMFILIDELFRGTNVKDAHDGTIAISSGFAKKRKSCFIISTHIMEAGEVLKERFPQISFWFLPTRMEGTIPVYPRKLEKGISADRHGMVIIHNEGIIEKLNKAAKAFKSHKNIPHEVPC